MFFDTLCVSFSFVFPSLVFEAAVCANKDVYIGYARQQHDVIGCNETRTVDSCGVNRLE